MGNRAPLDRWPHLNAGRGGCRKPGHSHDTVSDAERDEARFRIELPVAGHVRIEVFDLAGRRELPAGPNDVGWSTVSLAPGVYVARLDAGGRTAAVRFVRLR
jgi:hypothetical protein